MLPAISMECCFNEALWQLKTNEILSLVAYYDTCRRLFQSRERRRERNMSKQSGSFRHRTLVSSLFTKFPVNSLKRHWALGIEIHAIFLLALSRMPGKKASQQTSNTFKPISHSKSPTSKWRHVFNTLSKFLPVSYYKIMKCWSSGQ